jgi:threonine dehydrogenase-like Zn-dependent dehydrogenase
VYERRTDLEAGKVVGHENLGEVVEVGSAVVSISVGERVCLPFSISCGFCKNCQRGLTGFCLTVNPGNIAVYGAGPVGTMAAYSAVIQGASQVFVVDHLADHQDKARPCMLVSQNLGLADAPDASGADFSLRFLGSVALGRSTGGTDVRRTDVDAGLGDP